MAAKTDQLFLRIDREMNRWSDKSRAAFVRRILADEMKRSREEERITMFNRAAQDLTREELRDREILAGAFEDRD